MNKIDLIKLYQINNNHTMRDVLYITAQILELIPTVEKEFMEDMRSLISDFSYCAPESLNSGKNWFKLQILVNKHIKDTNVAWREKVIAIYTDKVDINST